MGPGLKAWADALGRTSQPKSAFGRLSGSPPSAGFGRVFTKRDSALAFRPGPSSSLNARARAAGARAAAAVTVVLADRAAATAAGPGAALEAHAAVVRRIALRAGRRAHARAGIAVAVAAIRSAVADRASEVAAAPALAGEAVAAVEVATARPLHLAGAEAGVAAAVAAVRAAVADGAPAAAARAGLAREAEAAVGVVRRARARSREVAAVRTAAVRAAVGARRIAARCRIAARVAPLRRRGRARRQADREKPESVSVHAVTAYDGAVRFPPIIVSISLVWVACASKPPEVVALPPPAASPVDAGSQPTSTVDASTDGGGSPYVTDPARCPPGTTAVIHQLGGCAPCLYGHQCPCSPTVYRCQPPVPPPPPPKNPNECGFGETCADGTPCQCCSAGGPRYKCLCTSTCSSDRDCTSPERPRCNMAPGAGKGMCTARDFQCCWLCK